MKKVVIRKKLLLIKELYEIFKKIIFKIYNIILFL